MASIISGQLAMNIVSHSSCIHSSLSYFLNLLCVAGSEWESLYSNILLKISQKNLCKWKYMLEIQRKSWISFKHALSAKAVNSTENDRSWNWQNVGPHTHYTGIHHRWCHHTPSPHAFIFYSFVVSSGTLLWYSFTVGVS